MNKILQKLIAPLCAASLCGCMVGPDFESPDAKFLPEKYSSPADGTSLTSARAQALPDEKLAKWWEIFNDPLLESLVERAFKGNLDLAAAKERIAQSRASLGVSQSGFFPSLDANAAFKEGGKIGRASPTYSMGAAAAWELDVFGGTRRGIEAAVGEYEASIADKCAVKISVAAEVAQAYFLYRCYERELIITKGNLETQKKTYEVTKRRRLSGFESDIDVVRAMSQVESTSAQIPQLESKMILARHSLEILLGLPTGSLEKDLSAPRDLPRLEEFIPAGVPARLIRRRPDIVRAECKLRAAVAKIGEAQADWYPKFSVTGRIGYEAPDIGKIVQNQYGTWSVGPSISWNVFQAGKTYFNVQLRKAAAREANVSWEKTALTAVKEVEDALVSAAKERARIAHINRVVESNRKAFKLSSKLYEEGEIEFLDLLEAQRSMLSAEQSQISSRQLFISHIISLYKALGGGWSPSDTTDDSEDKDWLFFLEDA